MKGKQIRKTNEKININRFILSFYSHSDTIFNLMITCDRNELFFRKDEYLNQKPGFVESTEGHKEK